MADRRALVEGIKPTTPVNPELEKQFVFGAKSESAEKPANQAPLYTTTSVTATQSRVPLSTRIRSDFSAALKRASLERQLAGVEPNMLQDILEQALEPWLKEHGYLS